MKMIIITCTSQDMYHLQFYVKFVLEETSFLKLGHSLNTIVNLRLKVYTKGWIRFFSLLYAVKAQIHSMLALI